jgi:NADPH:quinone reductase-like Zn-dependent oxidoreductase
MSKLVRSRQHPNANQPKAMKACRIHRFGPPNVIALEDVPLPEPDAGHVLVRVAAAGVGPWDAWIRPGRSVLPQPLPLTLGSDLSGVIVAVGAGVTAFAPGDAIFGVTNASFTGAYAEYAIASAGMIARKPAGIDDIGAASIPVVAVTAWQALFTHARLIHGQIVLIHGAAGNVGSYAAQLAHHAGLGVIATASERDLTYVYSLGADKVLDYRSGRFEDNVGTVDAVIDLVGGETQTRLLSVLRPGGILVSAVSSPDQAEAARQGVHSTFFLVNVTTDILTRIADMIEAGELDTNIGAVLPLAAATVAHEMLEGARPRPRGKIVLRVGA